MEYHLKYGRVFLSSCTMGEQELPSMASRYHHHIFVTILSILLFPSSLKAQQSLLYHNCNTEAANYTKDSPFQTNLKSLLDSLSSNGALTGYVNATAGTGTDRVYGLVQCRGDVNTSTCQSCLDVAPKDILDLCPNNTEAYIWYDYCFLRYSHQMFFSQPSDDFVVYMWNTGNITDEVSRYSEYLSKMMDPLALKGAYDSTERFATGEAMFSKEFPMLYGMVQCTMDQTNDDCYKCLRKILGDILKCCAGKLGGRVLSSVCIVRYEVYKFYDGPPTLTTLPPPGASGPTALPTPGASGPTALPTPGASGPTALPTPGASGPAALAHPAGKKKTARTILLLVIPLGTAFVFISVCCICFLKRKKAKQKHYRKSDWGEIASIESLLFALSAIRTATNDFSDATKVGQGGFGIVHKGVLENGQEIAVKRLSTSSAQGLKELKNEVVLLAKLQHRNLVKLLGVCVEEEEKLLIYEYVPNKSLDTFLFDDHQKEQLNWERRYKIITGVARGMLYLHEESQFKIIHRDLKASNVLLDADMIPKISDFGMAKLFEADQTHVSTQRVVGTLGYMSPEYAIRGQFSNKSDVFSFGVLVLEIMTSRKNSDFFNLRESTNLLSYVWSHWCHGSISEIMDPSFRGHCSYNEALRCIHIGLLCVQEAPNDRPTMSTVVLMLSSYSVTLQVPSQPAFLCSHSTSMPSGKIENVDIICSQDVNPQNNCRKTLFEKTEVQSINDATVSEFQPR